MPKQPRHPHVTIDPEFKSLITPLTDEEKNLLEQSIGQEACRDPLVTWRGILVDGHHRYEICTRLNRVQLNVRVTLGCPLADAEPIILPRLVNASNSQRHHLSKVFQGPPCS